jgi:7,8-dihydropterin-6-yl-methyl-4-(beta-D-ribofuranosyl)aminobenzene 5'-phosphate synthase
MTRITIIYDNCLKKQGLKTGWGFAALIETDGKSPTLFDTGDDGMALLHNMKKLNIEPGDIADIVISHSHNDHTGGLAAILNVNKDATIYLPAPLTTRIFGRKVVYVRQPVNISGDVFSTGTLAHIEQSLIIKTGSGLVVLTGCSHSGVGTIFDAAGSYGEIYGIIGGLHGFHDFNRLDGLSLVCPCHCTQYKNEISRIFPEQYVECGAGLQIEL